MGRKGRRVALARLIAGLVISTLATPVLADELSELRQQLAAQHKVMQALESRMMELEAKEKERAEHGVDFGYKADNLASRACPLKMCMTTGFSSAAKMGATRSASTAFSRLDIP